MSTITMYNNKVAQVRIINHSNKIHIEDCSNAGIKHCKSTVITIPFWSDAKSKDFVFKILENTSRKLTTFNSIVDNIKSLNLEYDTEIVKSKKIFPIHQTIKRTYKNNQQIMYIESNMFESCIFVCEGCRSMTYKICNRKDSKTFYIWLKNIKRSKSITLHDCLEFCNKYYINI